jgi:hypothetical protein
MSLLDRLFGPKDVPPEVREDATFGLPAGALAQKAARAGDWQGLRAILAAEREPARRWRYAHIAAEGLGERVAQWVEAEPGTADAWLVAGLAAISRGAQIRGAAKAEDTPEEVWDPFHECMEEAAEALGRASELAASDPLPHAGLLSVAIPLGAPIEERVTIFEEARRLAPALLAPHIGIVTGLAKKWGGSHEQMFDVARRSVAEAPGGSAIPAVLPLAHVERWLYLVHWEHDEPASRAYFRRAEVLRDVRDCHRRCARVEENSKRWVANVFAFCFYLADDARAARREFEKAEGLYTGLPWDYLGGLDAYEGAMKAIWKRGAPPRPAGS